MADHFARARPPSGAIKSTRERNTASSPRDTSPREISHVLDRTQDMNTFLRGVAVLAFVVSPAIAQSPSPQSHSMTTPQNQSGEPGSNAATAQKIRQDLQSAGFTDVKVVAESFVVQAKSKDGDPVLMTIGPRGMSVFEAMGTNSSSTTGSATSNPSNPAPNSNPAPKR